MKPLQGMMRGCAAMGLAAAFAIVPVRQIEAAERPLTLDEAIALALEKNENIHIERQTLEAADALVTGAHGAYDPYLSIEGGWRRASPPVNSAFSGAGSVGFTPWTEVTETSASVSQLLSTGGSITFSSAASRSTTNGAFALLSPAYATRVGLEFRQPLLRSRSMDTARLAIRVTGSVRSQAGASLRRVLSETVAAVERAYWKLTAARLEVGVQEESMHLAEEQLDQTRSRTENGVAPETELAQPRAEIERRHGELLASRENVARAENALKLLILDDSDSSLWLERLAPTDEATIPLDPIDAAAALDKALVSRPELEIARASIERRRAESAFATDTVRPALDAVVSYDRFGLAGMQNPDGSFVFGLSGQIPGKLEGGLGSSYSTLADGDFEDTRVGLVFSLPLGNRVARSVAAAARLAVEQSEEGLAGVRKAIRAEVLDAAAALETSGQRIDASRSAREAAEVQLSAEKDRYAVGLSTNFLVLTRQNDLSRARLAEIEALTDYRTARAELARSTGSLLDERRIELEAPSSGNGSR